MKAIMALALALLLLGCGERSLDYVQYTGTEGLDIRFAEGAPPEEVTEGMPVPVKVEVHNKGAYEVAYERMLLTFSSDPLYLDKGLLQLKPKEADIAGTRIQGRSVTYQEGETRLFSVPAANAFVSKQVLGTLQEPKAKVTASVCYAYATLLTASVCVDTSQGNARAQACEAADLTFSKGQGAPLAVTLIEVDAYPVYDGIGGSESTRPFFTIHVQDTGGGRLIGPDSLPLDSACVLRSIPQEEVGAVSVKAWLLDEELECQPALVKLFDRQGETRCTVRMDDLSGAAYKVTQNFMTTLVVNASYLYKDSAEAEFSIRRSSAPAVGVPTSRRVEGYVYDGDLVRQGPNGPLTVCEDYAANLENAPGDILGSLRADSTCACNQDECLRIARRGGSCVLKGGLCPSPMFCCSSSPPPEEPVE